MPLMEPLSLSSSRRRGGMSSALTTEEEDSLLRRAATAGMSGLGMVGNLLDLPGSMIRDVATWLPGGPAPANPLDQLLSPLSPDNRTGGRELLEGYGLRPNHETGISGWMSDPLEGVRDVAGFGAEVLLDPLTYLTFGASAAGKGGAAARAGGLGDDVVRVAAERAKRPLAEMGPREAGLTTKVGDMLAQASPEAVTTAGEFAQKGGYDLADYLNEPMRAMASAKIPFLDPIAMLGTGPTAVKAAKFLDKYSPNPFALGSAISQSTVGRAVGSLMDATRYGKLTKEATPWAQQAFRGTTDLLAEPRGVVAEAADRLAKAKMTDAGSARIVRDALEKIPGVHDPSGAADLLNDWKHKMTDDLVEEGYSRPHLDDLVDHSYRFSDAPGNGAPKPPTSGISTQDKARLEMLRGNTKGTMGTEDLMRHPAINLQAKALTPMFQNPKTRQQAVDLLSKELLSVSGGTLIENMRVRNAANEFLFENGSKTPTRIPASEIYSEGRWSSPNTWERVDAAGNVVETLTAKMESRSRALAEYMLDRPDIREKGLFPHHPVADFYRGAEVLAMKKGNAPATRGLIANYAKPAGTYGDDGVKVGQLMREVGLTGENALPKLASEMRFTGGMDELRNMEIPQHIAADWKREIPRWEMPESLQPFQKGIDSLTNLFKAGVLTRPARYVRDFVSGQARNVEAGMWDFGSAFGAHKLLHGGEIAGAADIPAVEKYLTARGLPKTDAAATDALRQLYAQHGPGHAIEQTDLAGRNVMDYTAGLEPLMDLTRGRNKTTLGDNIIGVAKTAVGRTPETDPLRFNPLTKEFWTQFGNVRGVLDKTETRLGPVAAGERIGRYTDDMNRLVPFIHELKKGVDPAEAMRRINDAQVLYDPRTFTPTEQVLKRLFPFYSFTSRQIKYAGKTLAERPGGGMGQSIRAINSGRDRDAMLPEHIADTAAIPLEAKTNDGTKRYLTGLGLMLEDPLSMLGGPRAAGLEVLSRMNPIVKGPLEWVTGATFFQKGPKGGRSLDDLDPTVGRILANIGGQKEAVRTPQAMEAILGNSPLSAALTMLRQGTDPRKDVTDKAILFGTGVRMSDVSPAAQDAMLREWVQDAEKKMGGKSYLKTYIPKEVKSEMTPLERMQAEQLEGLMNAINRRTKQRKAESGR